MKITVAADAFKGSLTAQEACRAIADGLLAALPDAQIRCFPLADGGEGTAACMVSDGRGTLRPVQVCDPVGRPVTAALGLLGDGVTAVVETAAASGLTLLKDKKEPMRASTFGTGQLIAQALRLGRTRIVVGLGGSATTDGGTGALAALGVRFYDQDGAPLTPGGENLEKIARIDASGLDPLARAAQIVLACDVENPFFGKSGAAHVFAPQKGATPEQIERLDRGLRNLAKIYQKTFQKDVSALPGAGAAGGLCGGLFAALNARVAGGFDTVAAGLGLEDAIAQSDVVVTGEGRTDAQTAFGKLPYRVGLASKKFGKPCICVSGAITPDADALCEAPDNALTALFSATLAPCAVEDAMRAAAQSLRLTCKNIGRLLRKKGDAG